MALSRGRSLPDSEGSAGIGTLIARSGWRFEEVGQPWGEMPAAGRTLKKVRRGGPALGRESCSWTHVEQFREGDEDNDEDDEN